MPTQLQRMSVQRPSLRACKPRLSQAGTCEPRLSVGSLCFPTGVAGGTSSACLVFACNVFGPEVEQQYEVVRTQSFSETVSYLRVGHV